MHDIQSTTLNRQNRGTQSCSSKRKACCCLLKIMDEQNEATAKKSEDPRAKAKYNILFRVFFW